MPLEISEIGIRLAVGEPASAPADASGGPPSAETCNASLSPQAIDELVAKCVQEVLSTLRMLGDR